MPEQPTPTNLLNGQIWAGWGPPIKRELITLAVERLVARQTGRPREIVGSAMDHSRDLGRYLLTKRLSLTEHAAVYKGVDRSLAREVAVKIHRNRSRHDTERELYESQRFRSVESVRSGLHESQTMSRLKHPNIVQIHDMGEHGSWLYSVMELCDETLSDWCCTREWPQIVDRFIEAARGLACLHEAGYAHGDIKGKNILVGNGAAKLTDFGFTVKPGRLGNKPCGTAGYIAPEVRHCGPGFTADVFALAVAIWLCLFGEMPYPAPIGQAVDREDAIKEPIRLAVARKIKAPEHVPRGLPRFVRPELERALHPDPSQRPSLAELIESLEAARDNHRRRSLRRRLVPLGTLGVSLTLGLGFSIGAARYRGNGDGSVVAAAFSELDPLTNAEVAAMAGDAELAIAELNRALPSVFEMSPAELNHTTIRVTRIAEVLESHSPGAALDARQFVYWLQQITPRPPQHRNK